jgi:L-alanine-DL-glutamate epimerase-like enolase superfamily enzyme
MKITAIKVYIVRARLNRAFWMSLEAYREASEIVVQVETDAGIIGIGEIHGRPLLKIAEVIRDSFTAMLMGRDPLAIETIYEDLFKSTCSRQLNTGEGPSGQPHFGNGQRPQIMAAIAGIDIALWDIKGKFLGLPVFRLLGGSDNQIPAYASGGYYGPDGEASIDQLVAEMASYVEAGFEAVKMKVGGIRLEGDVERVKEVRDAVGPNIAIFLDANQGYDVPSAIAAAKAFTPFEVGWFEEPVHWYDAVFGLRQVALSTHIPIASGESEYHRWGCRDLINHGAIRIMQFDSTRAGGVTEWLKVAGYSATNGVLMAPHHDPQIHGHLVAAVPNGYILETFPNRERDPLWEDLFIGRPEVKHGIIHLSERPGYGFEMNRKSFERYGSEFA